MLEGKDGDANVQEVLGKEVSQKPGCPSQHAVSLRDWENMRGAQHTQAPAPLDSRYLLLQSASCFLIRIFSFQSNIPMISSLRFSKFILIFIMIQCLGCDNFSTITTDHLQLCVRVCLCVRVRVCT